MTINGRLRYNVICNCINLNCKQCFFIMPLLRGVRNMKKLHTIFRIFTDSLKIQVFAQDSAGFTKDSGIRLRSSKRFSKIQQLRYSARFTLMIQQDFSKTHVITNRCACDNQFPRYKFDHMMNNWKKWSFLGEKDLKIRGRFRLYYGPPALVYKTRSFVYVHKHIHTYVYYYIQFIMHIQSW